MFLKGGREKLVGRLYQADRKTYCRISKPDLQVTKRIDTTPETNYNSNMMNYKSEILKRVQDDRLVNEAHRSHTPHSTHLTHFTHAKRAAFTLAEVLITLAIIGIVAAMTIPTLITNYQKKITVSKLQKVYSILGNMTKLLYADGVYNVFSGAVSPEKTEQFFNLYILPYFKSPAVTKDLVCPYESDLPKQCTPFKFANNSTVTISVLTQLNYGRIYFTTSDKTSYFINIMKYIDPDNPEDGREYRTSPEVWVDLNGADGPNTMGKDIFYFKTDFSKGLVMSYCASNSYEYINRDCSKNGYGFCCAAKIMLDGWKIKDDYPW